MSRADWIYSLIKKFGLEAEVVDKIFRDNPELDTDPVDKILELPDKPTKCYVWKVDGTDKQVAELTSKLQKSFVRKYNRDPEALHFIRNDIRDVEELSPDVVRAKVEPWLNKSGKE